MANAVYVALITAIYAAIFIVSSEFVMSYENLLSDSGWASFIISQNMKFVGIGMIGVAIIVASPFGRAKGLSCYVAC